MCPVPSTTRGGVMAPAWVNALVGGRSANPPWADRPHAGRCGDVPVTRRPWPRAGMDADGGGDRVALTARLFVSSTFQDLVEERNALQQDALPRLRELCRDRGI